MRRPLTVFALTAVAAGAVAVPASARDLSLSAAQEIAFLNAQRAANGLPSDITEDPSFSDGCAKHMSYLDQNPGGGLVHMEDSTKPGYTADGDTAGRSSVLTSATAAFSSTGADNFETAPIHLMQMLSPWIVTSGAASSVSGTCLNTLGNHTRPFGTATTFSYPGDGSTSVATSEVAFEGPFVPGAFVGLAPSDPAHAGTGYLTGPYLYFFYAGPAASPWTDPYFDSRGHFTSVSLTGPSGPVDVRSVDGDTTSTTLDPIGPYLPPGGILIPAAPIVANQKYTASVTYQPDADNVNNATGAFGGDGVPDLPAVSRTWSFSAGPVSATPPVTTTTPKPVVVGAPPAAPVKPVLTKFELKAKSVAVKSSASASLWVTIEQHVKKPGSKKSTWKLRRSQPLPATGGTVARVAVKKLSRGQYRVRILMGKSTGTELLSRTVTLR